ncbi:hypothetical protein EBB05_22580 [Methylobacterium brachiatum]|nr:hypothetical protein EBB05_22580 [Methylobacterium brachiatum]
MVELLSRPAASPVLLTLTMLGAAKGLGGSTLWGDSADRPPHRPGATSLTTRSCGFRVQLKPGTYCASMVSGICSLSGVMPDRSVVIRLQAWPASTCHPVSRESTVAKICRMRGV